MSTSNLQRIYDNLAVVERAERQRREEADRAMWEIRRDLYELVSQIPTAERGTLNPAKPPKWEARNDVFRP